MEVDARCLSREEANPCISYCRKQSFNQTDQWYACALLNYEIPGNEMTFPEVEHALKLVTKFTNVQMWIAPLLLGFMVGAVIGVSLVFLHCFCTKKLVRDRFSRFKLLPKDESRQQQKQNQQSQFDKRESAEIVRFSGIQSIGKG
ncbi:unnamed protein product, partial [Mesorhabditis belari]|uniref:Uncharacterized protein n=1 Tax=Mesorhabditis belari TaxID=2138241 RepID=A0AAF3F196_9BILA